MSDENTNTSGRAPDEPILRHESGEGPSLANMAFALIFFANLCLITLALFAMSEATGPIASLKNLLVGMAAAGAAYGVNRYAVDRLAPLHAVGFKLAGALAISAMLLIGSATALASLTGLIFGAVESKVFDRAGQEISLFVDTVNEASLVATRIVPAVETVAGDITQTSACEERSACLSNGVPGRGPMTRALDVAAGQAFSISEALAEGALERDALLADLNGLHAEYFEVSSDAERSIAERRPELQTIHAELRQVASALAEALPLGVVDAYVDDLRSGAQLAGDPAGTRALSRYLGGHAEALEAQLDDLPTIELVAPEFPGRPGMIDVLAEIPTYLAIAAVVIVGEMVLPLILYLAAYLALSWELEKIAGKRRKTPAEDPLGDILKRRLPKNSPENPDPSA